MTPRERAQYERLRMRHLRPGGLGVKQAASGATVVVTLMSEEPDADYGVNLTPSWNTTCWVTGRTTTQFTAHFGTAPGGSDTFDWHVFRRET